MSVNNFRYIHFAHYKDIPNWSVQYVVEEELGFTKKYPMAKIGSFLSRSKKLVTLQDNIVYKRVSVSTIGKGIAVRDTKLGKDIGTKKQYLVKKGQFLLSKIDARNGAFGVVPEEADGAIITGNFWAFDVDYNLLNPSNPQPIGFSGILLAKRQNSFYCTYFLHNRNVADTKSPYPIKRLEVIRWFNQKSMVFNQSLS